MSFDIYGNPLLRGHCERHPHVHEEYPCSVCMTEMQRSQARAVTHWDECWLDPRHHACAVGEIQRLRAERDALQTRVEELLSALQWLADGERGLSSETMCFWLMVGIRPRRGVYYPLDPPDLNRCLKFLEAVPAARARMDAMRSLSTVWSAFVDSWDEIEGTFLDEAGLNWAKAGSAPRTYALIRLARRRFERG